MLLYKASLTTGDALYTLSRDDAIPFVDTYGGDDEA